MLKKLNIRMNYHSLLFTNLIERLFNGIKKIEVVKIKHNSIIKVFRIGQKMKVFQSKKIKMQVKLPIF